MTEPENQTGKNMPYSPFFEDNSSRVESRRAIFSDQRRKARVRRKALVSLLILAFLALLISGTIVFLLERGAVGIPDVVGMSFSSAKRTLEELHLKVKASPGDEGSERTGRFYVVKQTPSPGRKVKRGALVILHLLNAVAENTKNRGPEKGKGNSSRRENPGVSKPRQYFDINKAVKHVTYLASTIGYREQGTPAEERAAEYIATELRNLGYTVEFQAPIPIPATGKVTRNVIAELKGTQRKERVIVVGAHIDSKGGPGANDNATGCAAVLELARVLKENMRHVPTIRFVFFGAEEFPSGVGGDNHHFGSRYYVKTLSDSERGKIAGMVSVDMVGAGANFYANSMGISKQILRDYFLEFGGKFGLVPRKDPGWSDHEPFEKARIPSVWIEFTGGNPYHSPEDNILSVNWSNVSKAGSLLQDFFEYYLTPERVDAL